ncbi:unnamed protein product [Rodentolepis nana]|uniref:uridine/cytidine kinase n=1 Tax=Rodentolepis nana TaxID=102285 RepID=A0A0R3TNJ4_RODNA|nr:unnamed protein product [Rodentolepis nana]
MKPLFIGVSGGAASGKNETCNKLVAELNKKASDKRTIILSLYSFYQTLSDEEISLAKSGNLDLDHPDAFDFDALEDTMKRVKNGESVTLKPYNPETFTNSDESIEIPAGIDIVFVEGTLTFYKKDIRDMFHLKIFVEADADTRLSRKVLRDVVERKRSLNAVLDNYFNFVKPAFEQFCLPTKQYANVILPRASENKVAADLIIEHLLQSSSNPPSSSSAQLGRTLRLRNQSESAVSSLSIRPH